MEPATYEVDQLLLGTILFTLAAFLFPTVLVYYLAFAAVRPLQLPLLKLALMRLTAGPTRNRRAARCDGNGTRLYESFPSLRRHAQVQGSCSFARSASTRSLALL